MSNRRNNFLSIIKYEKVILLAVVFLGIAVRLYGINLPLLESHQVRQAQTAMMTRNILEDNLDIFHTRLDIFGNVPGHIIIEFPLMHGITALLYSFLGVHEIIGRLISLLFSIGAMFLMYGLARRFLSNMGAIASLVLYVFSPMNIFFSRAFMPESSMMFFMVGAVFFFLKWIDKQSLYLYVAAIIFAAFSCLIKPTASLIFAPIFTAWFLKDKWGMLKRLDFWIYISLAIFPGVIWAIYANCFNASNTDIPFGFGGNWIELIRTRGIFEHWFSLKFYIFLGGSIILLLLTPLGFLGTLIGFFSVSYRYNRRVLFSWFVAIIIYFYILAGPNSGHIYYHLPLLPVAAIFFGFAIERLFKERDYIKSLFKSSLLKTLGICLLFLVTISYFVGYLKYFQYMYENRMPYTLEAAEVVKKYAPDNRFVIVAQNGLLLSVFSYYSHSKSWYFTISGKTIEELERLRSKGATTFVALDSSYENVVEPARKNEIFWRYLNEKYKPIAVTDHYFIFDIRNPAK